MKIASQVTQGKPGLGFGIRARILLAMVGLSMFCLALFSYVAFNNVAEIGYYSLQSNSDLGSNVTSQSAAALESLGRQMIAQKSADVARQAEIYIKAHPKTGIADLQADRDFQAIAVQKVGDTGYTSIMDQDSGYFYFHPQQALVNTDTHVFAQTLPAVWKILDQTIGKHQDAAGYYEWKEADGSIRSKYLALTLINGQTGDNKQLFVAATTYMDEFSGPVENIKAQIAGALANTEGHVVDQSNNVRSSFVVVLAALLLVVLALAFFLSRTFTRPIVSLRNAAKSIERGESFRPELLKDVTKSRHELADLARVFGDMAVALEQRAQDERLAADARYRRLFDGVPVGLYQSSPDGTFLAANPALGNMIGAPDEQAALATNMADLDVDPEERKAWRAALERDGVVQGFEFRQRRRDGQIIWTRNSARAARDESNQLLYYEGAIEDVTQRKQVEEQLQQTVQELSVQYREADIARSEATAVFDAASDGMILISPDQRVISANRRFSDLFFSGVDISIPGRQFDELRPQLEQCLADAQSLFDLVKGLENDGDNASNKIVKQRSPEPRDLKLHRAPVRSATGDHLGTLYAFRDVTREQEVDRMKSEFVSLVSHELRTPLTSIKGYVDLILDGEVGEISENQSEFLTIIKNNADRLVALINDLLDISRIEAGRFELRKAALDMTRIINGVASTLRPQIEAKNQKLSVEIVEGLPLVLADSDRVTQILTNLVSNAYKYTARGGSIRIAGSLQDGFVRVDVSDTGIGLSPEELTQLFNKFFRAKNRTTEEVGGTGLGLSITRSLIEMHGGEISVSSVQGQGTTFSFTLPATAATVTSVADIVPTKVAPHGGKVLVVDDEPDIANLIRLYLERGGYRVVVAHNGKEALRLAKSEEPDLITLDVQMGDVDGFTVLEWLKSDEATTRIPVIMVSMLAEEHRGKLLGATDYVSKPIIEHVLLQRVESLFAKDRPRTVLVAEDDDNIRGLVASYLRRAGYKVIEARDGAEALALTQEEVPGLLLLDIRMQGVDGIAALRALREQESTRHVPVMLMTASPDAYEDNKSAVEELGITGLLNKPFTAEDLASAIAKGLEGE